MSAVALAVTGRTLPPPELMGRSKPTSIPELMPGLPRGMASITRRQGRPRAELASLTGRVRDAVADGDREAERIASAALARALAQRGAELDRATKLARRSLSLGDDPALRADLAGWLSSLGEHALAAATLRNVVETSTAAGDRTRTLLRIAILLARAGDAEGAADALGEATEVDPDDPMPRELLGAMATWSEDAVSRFDAARAYLDAAVLRDDREERDAAFEDRLRAFEIAPGLDEAADAVADELAHQGRSAAADEIRRLSARHNSLEDARLIHSQRLANAVDEGDLPRAMGAMLDGAFETVDDGAMATVVDDLLRRAGLEEILAARLARRARREPPSKRAATLATLAHLASGSLALPDVALEAWLDLFSVDPAHAGARAVLRDRAERGDHEPLVEGLLRIALRDDPEARPAAESAARELAGIAEGALGDATLATWAWRRVEATGGVLPIGVIAKLSQGSQRHASDLEAASRDAASGPARIDALRRLAAGLRSRPDERPRLVEALAALVRASGDDATGPLRLLERIMARPHAPPTPAELELFESVLRDRVAAPLARAEVVRLRVLLASLLSERGDHAEAASELGPVLDHAAGHPLGAAHMLLAATRAFRPIERAHALTQLAEAQPQATRAVLLAVASEELLRAGENVPARAEAQRAAEADPSSVRAAGALAAAAGRDRDHAAAEVLEQRMGVVVPTGLLCSQLADALEALGEDELSLAWSQRWIALAPGDHVAAGELLRRAAKIKSAETIDSAIARVMGRPAPLGELALPLANAIAALGEVDAVRGRATARRALEVFGPRSQALRDVAMAIAKREGDADLATSTLERWVAFDAGAGTSVLFDLARRRAEAGDLAGAARDLRRAAEANADPSSVLAAATVLEARASRLEEQGGASLGSDGEIALADATVRALVGGDIRDGVLVARAIRNLGGALWDLAQDYRGAEQAFYTAVAQLPRFGLERYARDLWEFAGPEDACRAVEERATTLDDKDTQGRAALLVLLAGLCADAHRYQDAIAFALDAIDADPSQAQAVATVERCSHVEGGLHALDTAYRRLARAAMGKYGRRAAHYRAARQLERRDALDLAFDHATSAFEAVPEEGSSYVLLARLAEATQQATRVTAVIERAAAHAPAEERASWLRKAAALHDRSLDGVRARFDLLLRALHLSIEADLLVAVGAAAKDLVALGEPLETVGLRFERAVSAALPRLEGEPGARAALIIAQNALASIGARKLALEAISEAIVLGPEVPLFDDLVPYARELAEEGPASRTFLSDVVRAINESEVEDDFATTLPPGPPLLRLALAVAGALEDEAARTTLGSALAKAEARITPIPGPSDISEASDRPPASQSLPMGSHGGWHTEPGAAPSASAASDAPMSTTPVPPSAPSVPSGRPSRPASTPPPSLSHAAASMSLEQLERDAQQRGDHDAVAIFLGRRITAADSPDTRRLLRLRRAAVLEQRLGRPEDACRELEKLVGEFPDDRSALPFLADLYARLGDTQRAAPLWDRMAARIGATDDERTEYGVRSVRAYLEAGDAPRAREAFARAAVGAPGDIVAELRAELARASGDHQGIVTSLDDLVASGAIEEPERLATLLVEAARAAAASGDLTGALVRAKRAASLDPTSPDAILESHRLEYRLKGGGTPREAQAAIDDLHTVTDTLRPHQVELHAFLLAEMMDVVQGGGAGMRELNARHAEIGATPLIALGMAERLVRAKSYASALPLFQKALEGELQGLRTRTRVLLAAADAAAHAGDAVLAMRLAEEAESQPDGKAQAHRKRLEIVARHGPRPQALAAAEEIVASSSGAAKARALGQLARLNVDEDPERAESLYEEAVKHATGERALIARLSEELEALRQGEPPPPSVSAIGVQELASDLAVMAAAARAGKPGASASASPIFSASPSAAAESAHRETFTHPEGVSLHAAARAVSEAPRDETSFSDVVVPSFPPPAKAEPEPPLVRIETSPVSSDDALFLDVDILPPSLRGVVEVVDAPLPAAAPPASSPSSERPGAYAFVREERDDTENVSSRPARISSGAPPSDRSPPPQAPSSQPPRSDSPSQPPPSASSQAPSSRLIPPPPPSSRINTESPAESLYIERLLAGDGLAGDELVELWGPDALAARAHDVLAIRRRQLALAPHRIELIKATHEAATADGNIAYARALDHVIVLAGSYPRGGLPGTEPVAPPAPSAHTLPADAVASMLYRDLAAPSIELLALLWETGVARKEPAYYGLTGAERVSLGATTPIARLLASLAPLFGQARPAHFLPGPEPPRVRPALLAQPAILVTGDPHDDDPHLLFQLGATWAATQPENVIILGSTEFYVRNLLQAAKAAFGPVVAMGPSGAESRPAPSSSEVNKLAADIYQRVLPRTEKRLRAICDGDVDLSFETARDVARRSARRAGLLACGDLSTALAFVASDLGTDLAHVATPEGFEHAVANIPEVADLVRFATRVEYAEVRWQEPSASAPRRRTSPPTTG